MNTLPDKPGSAGPEPATVAGAPGPRAAKIEAELRAALSPHTIVVQDESHLHAGHAGAREGGHYRLRIVAPAFAGLPRVARHRLVYDLLGPLAARGIHALAIQALAPGEG